MKVRIMGRSYLSIRPYTSHRILLNVFQLHFILVVQEYEYVKQLGPVRANLIPTYISVQLQVRRHFSSETSR
jgi:hypothetical protein